MSKFSLIYLCQGLECYRKATECESHVGHPSQSWFHRQITLNSLTSVLTVRSSPASCIEHGEIAHIIVEELTKHFAAIYLSRGFQKMIQIACSKCEN